MSRDESLSASGSKPQIDAPLLLNLSVPAGTRIALCFPSDSMDRTVYPISVHVQPRKLFCTDWRNFTVVEIVIACASDAECDGAE